jgi:hypothetical protein
MIPQQGDRFNQVGPQWKSFPAKMSSWRLRAAAEGKRSDLRKRSIWARGTRGKSMTMFHDPVESEDCA